MANLAASSSSLAGHLLGGVGITKERTVMLSGLLRIVEGVGFMQGYPDVVANRPQILP